jgi:hypothetical protein
MLNRTNRTLSANLNRLNLGTRSLVLTASGNNGKSTLRARHAHGFTPRVGMSPSSDPSVMDHPPLIGIGIRSIDIPSLSPFGPWPVVGRVVEPWWVVPVVTLEPTVRPVTTTRPTCCGTETQAQPQRPAYPQKPRGYAKPAPKRDQRVASLGQGRAPARAARPAAATIAAAGG